MNQRTALQALDAEIFEDLADEGFAGTVSYTDGALTVAACRAYVRRDVQTYGSLGEVIGARTVVKLFRADVPAPKQGATVVIDGTETVVLDAKIKENESLSHWVVRRG